MERPTQNGPFDSTTEAQCGDLGQLEHSLGKKGRKIQVWMKMMEIDTGVKMDPAKTIGTITTRNSKKILMCAHSGYSAGRGREDQCLDTAKWNHLALHHMAKQIDFKFPGNIRDTSGQGQILDEHRGRAHAGHVEVLLACWFVIELLRKEASYVDKPEVYLISQLKRLKELKLGDRRLSFITIDSEPCRVCLQFLNKLSQYTDVVFMVIGSRGLGPVQVRIDGQRRQDMISDVFPDSGDELPDAEPSPSLAEAVEMARPDIPTPDPVVPTTPTPRLNLRPATSWGRKPTPWVPDDPEELISSYKKKTPVFEFDGYDRVEGDGHWEIISPGSRVRAVGSRQAPVPSMEEDTGVIDRVMEHDYLSEWEDLGDGLLVSCKHTLNNHPENTFVKIERPSLPPAHTINRSHGLIVTSTPLSGEIYARSAYQTVKETIEPEEMDFEIIEAPSLSLHRRNRRSAASAMASRVMPRLHEFKHLPIDDSNPSIFRNRYAILRRRR